MKRASKNRHNQHRTEADNMTAEKLAAKRAELRAKGINLRAFCEERGISYQAARELLIGRRKGHYGATHDAAVALGLKPAPATRELEAA